MTTKTLTYAVKLGTLTITAESGILTAKIGTVVEMGRLSSLGRRAQGDYTHAIGRIGIKRAWVADIQALARESALAAEEALPKRERLVRELADCERGAFPGSAAAQRESAAIAALIAYDREHA